MSNLDTTEVYKLIQTKYDYADVRWREEIDFCYLDYASLPAPDPDDEYITKILLRILDRFEADDRREKRLQEKFEEMVPGGAGDIDSFRAGLQMRRGNRRNLKDPEAYEEKYLEYIGDTVYTVEYAHTPINRTSLLEDIAEDGDNPPSYIIKDSSMPGADIRCMVVNTNDAAAASDHYDYLEDPDNVEWKMKQRTNAQYRYHNAADVQSQKKVSDLDWNGDTSRIIAKDAIKRFQYTNAIDIENCGIGWRMVPKGLTRIYVLGDAIRTYSARIEFSKLSHNRVFMPVEGLHEVPKLLLRSGDSLWLVGDGLDDYPCKAWFRYSIATDEFFESRDTIRTAKNDKLSASRSIEYVDYVPIPPARYDESE